MKTPDSRRAFHTPSRHYHRHRIQDPDPWNTWLGLEKKTAEGKRSRRLILWTLGSFSFVAVIAAACYRLL